MPRQTDRRRMFGFKATTDMITAVDERAAAEDLWIRPRGAAAKRSPSGDAEQPWRSEMLRIFAAYALETMPAGWRPKDWNPTERTPR